VGTTAVGSQDAFVTPLDTTFLGVEAQATVVDNLLQRDFVHRPVNGRMFESLAVVGLGTMITLPATTVSLSAGAFAALVGLSALWIGAVWLLSTSGVFLSPFHATIGAILAFLFVTVGKFGLERRRADRAIRSSENAILNR
jgi:adenylate cyclase